MRKKILYFHHGGGLGGAPRSLYLLLKNLDINKYDATLLFISKGPVLDLFKDQPAKVLINKRIYPFHGSTVVPKGSLFVFLVNIIGAPISFFSARRVIKKINPDIIHLNSSCLCMVAWAAKSVNKNIKVICHVREPLRKSVFGRIINQVCFKFVDQFIAIDRFAGNSMKTGCNIDVIYNPVDFLQYNSAIKSDVLRQELGLSKEAVIFLFLARVSPGNGAIELIQTAKKLVKSHPDFHFIIAGFDENNNNKYSQRVKKGGRNNDHIHLMNFRSDVPELIASSDILVVPFTEPHFARAAIEAAAMAKPCIGANVGGVNEVVKHNETGFLYNNQQDLYDYCLKLGSDKKIRLEMGKRAAVIARENFDSVRSAHKVFCHYEDSK